MLKKLFKSKQKKAEKLPAIKSLSPAIKSSIRQLAGTRGLPSMPKSAHQAFQLSIDPNAELQDFVEIIEADEGLASRIVKIANSVYFGRPEPCETINDAVVNIGMDELKSILNANTLSDIFPSRHPARAQLWMHNVAVGLIAREVAKTYLPNSTGEAFVAGLMHDIGKLMLLQCQPVEYEKIIAKVHKNGEEYCQLEEDRFICNHTEVGQLVGEQWNFPENIVETIVLHHQAFSTDDIGSEQLSLVQVIKAANTFAHTLGLGHTPGQKAYQRAKERQLVPVWSLLKINPAERKDFLARLSTCFESEYQFYVN